MGRGQEELACIQQTVECLLCTVLWAHSRARLRGEQAHPSASVGSLPSRPSTSQWHLCQPYTWRLHASASRASEQPRPTTSSQVGGRGLAGGQAYTASIMGEVQPGMTALSHSALPPALPTFRAIWQRLAASAGAALGDQHGQCGRFSSHRSRISNLQVNETAVGSSVHGICRPT